jgi:hypothetical protein
MQQLKDGTLHLVTIVGAVVQIPAPGDLLPKNCCKLNWKNGAILHNLNMKIAHEKVKIYGGADYFCD